MKILLTSLLSPGNIVCCIGTLVVLIVCVLGITCASVNNNNVPDDSVRALNFFWGWDCINNRCVKTVLDSTNRDRLNTLPICHLKCGKHSTLWPQPTGVGVFSNVLSEVDFNQISFEFIPEHTNQADFWEVTKSRFFRIVSSKIPQDAEFKNDTSNALPVVIQIGVNSASLELGMDTDESSGIFASSTPTRVDVIIQAETYYGARHALESISQLILFDEFDGSMVMPSSFTIEDGPVYKYRGLLLDTARRYYSLEAIERTIDAMALVKLNVFHWHITDSQSFAMVLKSFPELAQIGAYSPRQVYTPDMIAEVVAYAKVRGIQVIPEFDAPSHVGEGWQFSDLITCYNQQPWETYCVGPPCGQFDVTKDELYTMMEEIYKEMNVMFDNPDLFHMGGDEVVPACWNVSTGIQNWMLEQGWGLTKEDFIELWVYFQRKVADIWETISPSRILLWTSTLTDSPKFDEYLDKEKYIIHIWTNGDDPTVRNLLEKGYDLVMSNSDRFYFDCGFGSWVNDGNNWCSPYKGWHRVYDNNLKNLAYGMEDQILGGEACLWSSINDEQAIDSRLWPRTSALGERLWAEPDDTYKEADQRMVMHREFLVQYGIGAESIQPEWCLQHGGECPSNK